MATRLAALLVVAIVGTTLVAGLIVGAQRDDSSGPVDLIIHNAKVYAADDLGTIGGGGRHPRQQDPEGRQRARNHALPPSADDGHRRARRRRAAGIRRRARVAHRRRPGARRRAAARRRDARRHPGAHHRVDGGTARRGLGHRRRLVLRRVRRSARARAARRRRQRSAGAAALAGRPGALAEHEGAAGGAASRARRRTRRTAYDRPRSPRRADGPPQGRRDGARRSRRAAADARGARQGAAARDPRREPGTASPACRTSARRPAISISTMRRATPARCRCASTPPSRPTARRCEDLDAIAKRYPDDPLLKTGLARSRSTARSTSQTAAMLAPYSPKGAGDGAMELSPAEFSRARGVARRARLADRDRCGAAIARSAPRSTPTAPSRRAPTARDPPRHRIEDLTVDRSRGHPALRRARHRRVDAAAARTLGGLLELVENLGPGARGRSGGRRAA